MATILSFRARGADTSGRTLGRTETSAEIVIFPGIRYERWPAAEQKSETTGPRAARDVLKLVE